MTIPATSIPSRQTYRDGTVVRRETMRQLICAVALITVLFGAFSQQAYSQDNGDERLDRITERIDELESRKQRTGTTIVLFLFAAFCALWAQNTNRSAWLW